MGDLSATTREKYDKEMTEDRNKFLKQINERGEKMHYRNGREAKNGDKIISLDLSTGQINAFGVLHSAVAGNDYCNGFIAPIQNPSQYACITDCLHVDDVMAMLAEKGMDKRPVGK